MIRRAAAGLAACLLFGAACEAADPGATGPDTPTVTFVGDSWTAGSGASESGGFPELTAEQLGWRYTVLGSQGSGYVEPGRHGTFGSRIDEAVVGPPDVLVVQGSLNDQFVDPDELAVAVPGTLSRLREAADPGTEVVVLGAPYTPLTDAAAIDRINAVVGAAADSAGFLFVDVAAEKWTDPADPGIWADPLHPDDSGHQHIADRLATVLTEVVDS